MLRFMFRPQESFDLSFFELLVTLTQLPFVALSLCANIGLVVQDNTQEGIVDAKSAVVLDEAQLPEFVHEKIDPRACCADHLRQHLLRYFGKYLLRLVRRAITREQQQGAVCQPHTRERPSGRILNRFSSCIGHSVDGFIRRTSFTGPRNGRFQLSCRRSTFARNA